MKIVFDDKAISDLQAIREWIERDSATSAEKVLKPIFSAISALDRFPKRGRLGRHPKTHELIIAGLPYLVVYQIDEAGGAIAVTAVVHMARDRSSINP